MDRAGHGRGWGLIVVCSAALLAGCAEWLERPAGTIPLIDGSAVPDRGRWTEGTPATAVSSMAVPSVVGGGLGAVPDSDAPVMAAAEEVPADLPPAHGTQEQRAVDNEFYDPFEKQGEEPVSVKEYDPWESFNVAIFNFNRKVDKYLLKPVAEVYDRVIPDPVELSIRRFFHNVRFVPRMLNNLFQGKFKGAGLEMGRFVINSSLGLAGFFDVAKDVFDMETPDEDLGQTLGVYGVKPGRYLVLPIPPFVTTVRDLVGYIGDIFLDPINYFVFPVVEIRGAPSVVPHSHRTTTTVGQFGTRAGDVINERSINLESFAGIEESTIDLYSAVRNAYLQRRAQAIRQ